MGRGGKWRCNCIGVVRAQASRLGPPCRHGHSPHLMDGLFEAQRDSVLSSRSHSEGKRQNQREKSGSSLVLRRGVKGGGQDQSPLSTLLFFAASVSPRSPRAFLMRCSLPFFDGKPRPREEKGLTHTGPHTVSRLGPEPGAISVLTKGRGKLCFPQTVCLPSPHLWQTVQLEPLGWPRAMLGGRDGRVLGRESCQGGAGQLPRGRAPRSPNPRRKPNVFSRS